MLAKVRFGLGNSRSMTARVRSKPKWSKGTALFCCASFRGLTGPLPAAIILLKRPCGVASSLAHIVGGSRSLTSSFSATAQRHTAARRHGGARGVRLRAAGARREGASWAGPRLRPVFRPGEGVERAGGRGVGERAGRLGR